MIPVEKKVKPIDCVTLDRVIAADKGSDFHGDLSLYKVSELTTFADLIPLDYRVVELKEVYKYVIALVESPESKTILCLLERVV